MSLKPQIRNFIIDSFMMGRDEDSLADDSSLLDMGVIDSTGVLELVGFLEESYEISVDDDELIPDNLDSINNLVGFVERKQGGAAAAG